MLLHVGDEQVIVATLTSYGCHLALNASWNPKVLESG